jgi:hypothetical protein
MKPISEGGLGFTLNQIKIKLFGLKSSFDLDSAEIEEFESAELLHQQPERIIELGRRVRDPINSPVQVQASRRPRLQI